MQRKASAPPKPRQTLEKTVRELIETYDLGAVTFCAAAIGNGYSARALLRHLSLRANKRLLGEVKASPGGRVRIKDIPAIMKCIAEEPIAHGQGASFEEALAALRDALEQENALGSLGIRRGRRGGWVFRRTRLAKIARTARRSRRKRASLT